MPRIPSDEDADMNRRKVLKGIGGGIGAAVGTQVSVSIAAADGNSTDPITILEGKEKRFLAREIAQYSQFDLLLEKANELGYDFEWNVDNIDAGRVRASEFRRDVVAYMLTDTGSEQKQDRQHMDDGKVRAGIVLARDRSTGTLEFAKLDFEHYQNGLVEYVKRYEAATGVSTTQLDEPTPDSGIEKKTIQLNAEKQQEFINELEQSRTARSQIQIPDVLNINTCSGCHFASGIICRTLCSSLGAFACGLLGITVIGVVSCVTFVKAVCWVASKVSGCGDTLGDTICNTSVFDVCHGQPENMIDVNIPYV